MYGKSGIVHGRTWEKEIKISFTQCSALVDMLASFFFSVSHSPSSIYDKRISSAVREILSNY